MISIEIIIFLKKKERYIYNKEHRVYKEGFLFQG